MASIRRYLLFFKVRAILSGLCVISLMLNQCAPPRGGTSGNFQTLPNGGLDGNGNTPCRVVPGYDDDGDCFSNVLETQNGSNPNDPGEVPGGVSPDSPYTNPEFEGYPEYGTGDIPPIDTTDTSLQELGLWLEFMGGLAPSFVNGFMSLLSSWLLESGSPETDPSKIRLWYQLESTNDLGNVIATDVFGLPGRYKDATGTITFKNGKEFEWQLSSIGSFDDKLTGEYICDWGSCTLYFKELGGVGMFRAEIKELMPCRSSGNNDIMDGMAENGIRTIMLRAINQKATPPIVQTFTVIRDDGKQPNCNASKEALKEVAENGDQDCDSGCRNIETGKYQSARYSESFYNSQPVQDLIRMRCDAICN